MNAQNDSMAHRLLAPPFGVNDQNILTVEGVSVEDLANEYGSPLFVYSAARMRDALNQIRAATHQRVDLFYSIKANPHPAIIRVFREAGAGAEIASGAEYEFARRAGVQPDRIVFAGPGKSTAELAHVVKRGIAEIHVEAIDELERLRTIASNQETPVSISLRINPVDSAQGGSMRMGGKAIQFGIDEERIESVLATYQNDPWVTIKGIHLFAGTQILDADVLLAQWTHGLGLAKRVAQLLGKPLDTIDLGGGLGIACFPQEKPLDLEVIKSRAPAVFSILDDEPLLTQARVILEPGRFLAGPAGIYVTQVASMKQSRDQWFAVTNGGMNHHLAASGNLGQVIKKDYPLLLATGVNRAHDQKVTVVGPLCTPLDTYGRKTPLPMPKVGDLIAVMQSGAYGLSASPSGFLSQPMAAEVLIDNGKPQLIRAAGSFENPVTGPIGF
ncbi:MAG: type III PLP-dependent enzyme [Burkholderiaceae bacterium]